MNGQKNQHDISTDEAEKAISEALRSLPRVDAPEDFERRVMARIAEGEGNRVGRAFGFPRFAYVFAALALAIAGFGLVNWYRNEIPDVAVTREAERSVPPVASEPLAVSVAPTGPSDAGNARTEGANSSSNSGGSVTESAARESETVAGGADPKQPVARQQGSSIGAGEMLAEFGAEVSFEGDGWTVKKVFSGSHAAATGFKPGDRVLAVDGITLALDTRLSSPFEGKMFLVRRPGGEKLIALAAK